MSDGKCTIIKGCIVTGEHTNHRYAPQPERCNHPGCPRRDAHYTHTDGLGYYHFACDEHDTREFFQELRQAKQRIAQLETIITELHDSLDIS